jgi:hypothetical protein
LNFALAAASGFISRNMQHDQQATCKVLLKTRASDCRIAGALPIGIDQPDERSRIGLAADADKKTQGDCSL